MALIKKGSALLTIQKDWTVTEDENYLLTGDLVYEGDWAYRASIPANGSLHPYDSRLTCYGRTIQRLGLDKVRGTLKYIGIVNDPTPFIIEHPGGNSEQPIETHENFVDFAGTPSAPLNGAKFDAETGEFAGFTDVTNSLKGVKVYIVPSVMVSTTHYTHYIPTLSNSARITAFPPIPAPPNCRNFLLIGQPYRQIGNLYQVTNQYLGSGPDGWSTRIY
jgi:hypothetical protein